jgi:hypothetical protein
MAQQNINVGSAVGDGTGDSLRTAGMKVNANFTELYTRAPGGLSGLLAADAGTGNYRVAVIADISFAGVANGLATLNSSGKVPMTQLQGGVASGVATLDASGKLTAGQLPALAINDVFSVASQAAMLALTAERGDVAIRSDTNTSYILAADDPTTLANWKPILFSAPVVSVAGLTGAISSAGLKTALSLVVADLTDATANAKSLLGMAYAAMRTALGLGGAALLNVGTAASTVAAGDDSRITGAAQLASNNAFSGINTFTGSIKQSGPAATSLALDRGGQTGIVVANGASAIIGPAGSQDALVKISEVASVGGTAFYLLSPWNNALVAGSALWVAPTATPGAGQWSVAYDGTNLRIYNNVGSTCTFRVTVIAN